MIAALAALALFATDAGAAPAQAPAAALHGSWTATAGAGRVFRGAWTAGVAPGDADVATGTWTLLGDAGQVLLAGSWSARKAPRRWQGSWSARIADGPPFSGTWQAAAGGFAGTTLRDLLAASATRRMSGSWRRGRAGGNWWVGGD